MHVLYTLTACWKYW